jgi:hypothetical protein
MWPAQLHSGESGSNSNSFANGLCIPVFAKKVYKTPIQRFGKWALHFC